MLWLISFLGVAAQVFYVFMINVVWTVMLYALVKYMLPPLIVSGGVSGGSPASFAFPPLVIHLMSYLYVGRCIALVISTVTLKFFRLALAGLFAKTPGFPLPINFPGR